MSSFTKKCILLADHSYLIYILSQLPEDGYAGNDTAYTSFIRSDTGPDLDEESVRLLPNPFRETFILEIDATDADRADIDSRIFPAGSCSDLRKDLSRVRTGLPLTAAVWQEGLICSGLRPGTRALPGRLLS